jgi:hypothetical protein
MVPMPDTTFAPGTVITTLGNPAIEDLAIKLK